MNKPCGICGYDAIYSADEGTSHCVVCFYQAEVKRMKEEITSLEDALSDMAKLAWKGAPRGYREIKSNEKEIKKILDCLKVNTAESEGMKEALFGVDKDTGLDAFMKGFKK